MGKKVKSKSRLDPYYHFAKSQGYRSRAAYKLIQLNRKFNFLSSSNVLIDLCAAPGGWMQIAAEFMPLGSTIVGVDLDPIKRVQGTMSFIGDITTKTCYERLKKELKGRKSDVVLNDGAPNVGAQWNKDAYTQNELTLSALQLACSFLREGGYFVTKVFRSTDFNSLIWVFNKFFQKVEVTKPKASRFVSAEIFVVCIGFLAPSFTDEKLFDAKYIFKDTEADHYTSQIAGEMKSIGDVLKKRRKRGGYADDMPMHMSTETTLTAFINCENPLTTFASFTKITIDDEERKQYIDLDCKKPEDIEQSMKDLQVLGKRELGRLIKWRGKVRQHIHKIYMEKKKKEAASENGNDVQIEYGQDSGDELEAEMLTDQKKLLRNKRNKQEKRKEDLIRAEAANQNNNEGDQELEYENLKEVLDEVSDIDNVQYQEFPEEEEQTDNKPKYKSYSAREMEEHLEEMYESKQRIKEEKQRHQRNKREAKKDLRDSRIQLKEYKLAPRRFAEELKERYAQMDREEKWKRPVEEEEQEEEPEPEQQFSQVRFNNPLAEMDDEDIYISDSEAPEYDDDQEIDPNERMEGELSDDDAYVIPKPMSDMERRRKQIKKQKKKLDKKAKKDGEDDDGMIEIVPEKRMEDYDMTSLAETLAIAKKMIRIKSREEILEGSYRGFTFEDHDDLPKWFTEDEKKHNFKAPPITKEEYDREKARLQAINARLPKKIMEAKVRKKIRVQKKLKKVQKKAEGIMNQEGLNEVSKLRTVTKMYDKSKSALKDNKKYLVGKKGKSSGKKDGRNIKHVDSRMKKDKRAIKAKQIKKTRHTHRGHKRRGKF